MAGGFGTTFQGQYGSPVTNPTQYSIPGVNLYGSSAFASQGSAGAGGVGSSPQDLINQYQQAYDQAKKANETRYSEILGGYRSRRDRALADLAGSGDQERKDIAQEASNFEGRMGQDAVSRGLAGTSVLPAGKLAAAKFKADATGRLDERLRQQRIGLDTGLDQDTLQFMERRNDTYPDFEMLAKLSQGMGGASGSGFGGVMGGGGGAGYGKKSQYAGSRLVEPREIPQQGAGESDAAFQQRYSKWSQWEQQNTPTSRQWYGQDAHQGPGLPMNPAGREAQRAAEEARNAARNRPRNQAGGAALGGLGGQFI